MGRKRLSTLPEIPKDATPALRKWLLAAKESLEVRLGRRGDPGEAAVTFNDLVDLGFAQGMGKINPLTGLPILTPTFPSLPGGGGELPNFGTPPQPTNVIALGVFGGIHVLWDRPVERPDITFTEVYRSQDADFENADLIGGTGGASYFDIITQTDEVTYWYWVRHVSINGREGPLSVAVTATKPANVGFLLEQLSGQISANEFVQALNERIDLIDGDGFGSVNQRIEAESQLLTQQITTVQSALGDDIASVQQTLSASIDNVENQLGAQYTLALDVNGYISGYTTYNDGQTSAIVFRTDTFAIGSPASPNYFPFVLDGGVVYIDTAIIKEGSIESGKIGSITFGKVVDADGNPVTTVGGILRGDLIDATGITVTTAMIEDAAITAAKIGDAQVTNAKIANAAVQAANIGNLQVTNAKIANAAITSAKIQDAAVDTLQLAGQAVTIPVSAYTAGEISFGWSNTSETTIQSVSFNSSGAPKYVHCVVRVSTMPTNKGNTLRVRRNGSAIWSQATGASTIGLGYHVAAIRDTNASATTLTYTFTNQQSNGDCCGTTVMRARSIFVLETKR